MRKLGFNGLILLFATLLSLWAIWPPQSKLRLGKDLAGGATLVYGVDVKAGETDVISRVVEVIKERIDPNGVLEISVVAVGKDRIEITMPLPTDKVKQLRAEFDSSLAAFAQGEISRDDVENAMTLPVEARASRIAELARGDQSRADALNRAAAAHEALRTARASLNDAQASVDALRKLIDDHRAAGGAADDPQLVQWAAALPLAQQAVAAQIAVAAPLEIQYEADRASALAGGLTGSEVRRSLSLSDRSVRLRGEGTKVVELDSPRKRAVDSIRAANPDALTTAALEATIAAWDKYQLERRTLDDPSDLIRMLKGAGVLNFRITVNPGEFPDEQEARNQLRIGGPSRYRTADARWFKLNKLESWIDNAEQLEIIKDPAASAAYFAQQRGAVVEQYRGEYFMLCWDRRGLRLTQDDGNWSVRQAFQGADNFGRPAIDFRMDALGGDKLGALTEKNTNKQMAVLLDDEVYTAPRLISRISDSGQITGNFSPTELSYIIRVLSAGSLAAKLTPEPISQSILGPSLGADNLRKGLTASVVSFIAVSAFMIVYYFGGGVIAVVALAFNALLLVGAMSLNQAAFTLPGIAGIMLTFGQAVDANVLIYERMREEFRRGEDLRTAVRLGFDKALSAIVDGNVTTLIVCVVLGFTGTQEIKGFALTLGIGVVTTLFAQLVFTRFVFNVLTEKLGFRKMSMLPMMIPGFEEAITPRIDWLKLRGASVALSVILTIASVGIVMYMGSDLLSSEFRGGTTVTLVFKDQSPGTPARLSRAEVEDRVEAIAATAPQGSILRQLTFAEVIAVNPNAGDFTSNRFTVKTLVTDPGLVQKTLGEAFADKLAVSPAVSFKGSDASSAQLAPVFPITSATIGESIDRPGLSEPVGDFFGGAAIVLENLTPPVARADLVQRLEQMRNKPEYIDAAIHRWEVRVIEGSDEVARSAVILVRDPESTYLDDTKRWEEGLRASEWAITTAAITQSQTMSDVQSFSPSVAATFRAQAVVALLLSTLLVVIYVWVRFSSLRYSLAAIVTTLHDCVIAVGFVALANVLHAKFPGIANTLGILPFKIDLNVMAAILTILGFSLNGVIVVMDRVRENRGKLPYASRNAVNSGINQTFSRTIITAGTTVIAVVVLYVMGGEAVRVFAYTLLVGVLSATYSAIGVAPTLVWSRQADPHAAEQGVPAIV